MKIWEVEFSIESGPLGTLTTEADTYQHAIDKVRLRIVRHFKLTKQEIKTLYLNKAEIIVETDVD